MESNEIRELNFDIFHPLDHLPGSPVCWTFYGGLQRHIKLGWELKWWPWVRCKVGVHNWATWYMGDGTRAPGQMCWGCMTKRNEDGQVG